MEPNQVELPDGVLIPLEERKDKVAVKLSRAVKHGATELLELELGPLKGAHVRRAPNEWQSADQVLRFAAELAALPDSIFDQLTGTDVGAVVRATVAVSWPLLDLPPAWEDSWKRDAAAKGERPRELPQVRGGHILELERAAKRGRDTSSRLVFQEVTGKVARQCPLDGLPLSRLPWLVSELTGAPREMVDELQGRDLNRALALAVLFFLAVRGTGATDARPSPSASAGPLETSTS